MYKRVVVPLDGSALAEAILPFITDIAGPLDLEVVLLRVLVPVPPDIVEGSARVVVDDLVTRRDDAEAYLAQLAEELTASGIRTKVDVRRGDPVREILAGAQDAGADLIAMTTHGRSGLGRLLFGSVAEAVLREAEIPVFLMRLTEKQLETRTVRGVVR